MPEMQKFYPGEYLDWEKALVEERLGIASAVQNAASVVAG